MIENGFVTTRVAALHAPEAVLRVGLVNFLKELERSHLKLDALVDEGGEQDVSAFIMEPWEIADKLFQFIVFTRIVEEEEGTETQTEDLNPTGDVMTAEEIEAIVQQFSQQIDETHKEENEND